MSARFSPAARTRTRTRSRVAGGASRTSRISRPSTSPNDVIVIAFISCYQAGNGWLILYEEVSCTKQVTTLSIIVGVSKGRCYEDLVLFDLQHLLDLFRAVAFLAKVPRPRFQQIEIVY